MGRLRALLILVGASALAFGLGYGLANLQGQQALDTQQAECGDTVLGISKERDQAKEELEKEQARSTALDAYRYLHLALLNLEHRNFGIAQKHTRESARLLAGLSDLRMTKLAKQLEGFEPVVTEDVGEQRKQLLSWSEALDELVASPGL